MVTASTKLGADCVAPLTVAADDVTVNRLDSNELSGIVANGGTAIQLLEGATDTAVRLNLLYNNALGIQVGGSGNVVQANKATHNQIGINVDGSANTIRANVADDNALGGIQVGAGGTDNLLRANRARRNGVYDFGGLPGRPVHAQRVEGQPR
jgi:parallel beta-helix repeat protein